MKIVKEIKASSILTDEVLRQKDELLAQGFKHENANSALSNAACSVAFRDATWEESCDECAHQEGRHYCLLHSISVKNMDAIRCDSFRCKYSQNK